jgi:hypothetical protein
MGTSSSGAGADGGRALSHAHIDEDEHGTGVERKRVMELSVRKRVTASVLYRPTLCQTTTESRALARCPTRGKNCRGRNKDKYQVVVVEGTAACWTLK